MMRNMTFSFPWKNRLTKAKAFWQYAVGAALAVLVGVWTGDGGNVLPVALVGLLFRIWEGLPVLHPLGWGAEFLAGGLAVGLAEQVAQNGREEWLTAAYWGIFLIMLVAFCIAARHFLLSAGVLTAIMMACLSPAGTAVWKSALITGAVCGFFPRIEKNRRNITFM